MLWGIQNGNFVSRLLSYTDKGRAVNGCGTWLAQELGCTLLFVTFLDGSKQYFAEIALL